MEGLARRCTRLNEPPVAHFAKYTVEPCHESIEDVDFIALKRSLSLSALSI
jgi:hypothetical protein